MSQGGRGDQEDRRDHDNHDSTLGGERRFVLGVPGSPSTEGQGVWFPWVSPFSRRASDCGNRTQEAETRISGLVTRGQGQRGRRTVGLSVPTQRVPPKTIQERRLSPTSTRGSRGSETSRGPTRTTRTGGTGTTTTTGTTFTGAESQGKR